MTRLRRSTARVVAALAIAAGAALSFTPTASAVTVDGSGWFWRPNTNAAPLPVPPRADVGADQLLVEGEPEGAVAVAAARFTLAEGETSPILTVTPTPDSTVPAGAVILACRIASAWVPTQGGKWEARPMPDCFTSVQGIPADGGKLTFPLTPLQSGTTLEVAFYPGNRADAPAGTPNGSVFSLKFAKPTAADLQTTTGDAGGFSGTGGDFSPPDASSFGADDGAGDAGSSGSGFDAGTTGPSDVGTTSTFGPSPAFSQPSSFAAPTAVAPAASPSGLTAAEQAGPSGVVAPAVPSAPASNTSTSPKGRTLGILVLLAGAALGFWAYSGGGGGLGIGLAPATVPAAAPPGAEPVLGGLGRFARPRTGPPPSLS